MGVLQGSAGCTQNWIWFWGFVDYLIRLLSVQLFLGGNDGIRCVHRLQGCQYGTRGTS